MIFSYGILTLILILVLLLKILSLQLGLYLCHLWRHSLLIFLGVLFNLAWRRGRTLLLVLLGDYLVDRLGLVLVGLTALLLLVDTTD